MRVHSLTRYIVLAAFVGALACARNPDPADETAAARDTVTDTLAAERDTAATDTLGQVQTPGERSPSDTFLDTQGQGTPQDTAGFGGLERVDTTGQAGQQDTTGFGGDTTGMSDTTGMRDTSGMGVQDTTGTAQPGDTTGYNPSQESRDTTY